MTTTPPSAGSLTCDGPLPHPRHDWDWRPFPSSDPQRVTCDGLPPEAPRGQCCADPLCPCAVKMGSGAYTDSGRRTFPPLDVQDGEL